MTGTMADAASGARTGPGTVWDDLVGQEPAVQVLRHAVDDPTAMTHAWLITGPPGSGRSNAARAFAAALQDPSGDLGSHACATALAGTHPDVTIVATEGVVIRAEVARPLVELAQRSPSEGRWRVIIVEDADRLNETSGNVLLKAIEEPPPRTVWVLCAPSPQDVLVTIRSRSRSVPLRVPPVQAVAELLVRRDGVEPGLALIAARAAQSHIGIARRLARDPEARARRSRVLALATSVRGVGDAVLAAGELVEVAQAEAKKHNWKMNIAVVGPAGELVYFEKMDGAQLASIAIAQHKARTAAAYRRETRLFQEGIDGGHPSFLTLDGVIASEGGFPLVENGKIIGAIGCSGGTAAQDGVTCKAAAETVK